MELDLRPSELNKGRKGIKNTKQKKRKQNQTKQKLNIGQQFISEVNGAPCSVEVEK